MSDMRDFEALALQATCGHAAASQFLVTIASILHTWDDLIDRDGPVTDEAIHDAFVKALLVLPSNTFYRQHCDQITPLLTVAIQNWWAANAAERGQLRALPLEAAFVIRSTYVDLVTFTATICGGMAHGAEVAQRVRALAHREGMSRYLQNLSLERKAREGDE